MAKYLVLYRSSTPPGEMMSNMTPEQAKAGMEAWMEWAQRTGPALVDMGAPLTDAGSVGTPSGTQSQPVCGFSILEAGSKAEVESKLDAHPHLESPGDTSIEILEFLPVPGS